MEPRATSAPHVTRDALPAVRSLAIVDTPLREVADNPLAAHGPRLVSSLRSGFEPGATKAEDDPADNKDEQSFHEVSDRLKTPGPNPFPETERGSRTVSFQRPGR